MNRTAIAFILLIIFAFLPAVSESSEMNQNFNSNATAHSGDNGVLIEFDLSGIEQNRVIDQNNASFSSVMVPDEGFTYDYGMPVLPMVSRFVIVPPDAGLELIVTAEDPEIITFDNRPVVCNDSTFAENARVNLNRYDRLYPEVFAEMSEPTIIRGVRLVKITTYPIQFDLTRNRYLHRSHIQTEIRFTDAEPINPVRNPERRNLSRDFSIYINALAVNADVLDRDDMELINPNAGHYLIMANERCIIPSRDFIEWRRKSGYKVDIIAASNPNSTGGIKNEIQDKYDEYVDNGEDPFDLLLLIGDYSAYYQGVPGPGWQLVTNVGESIWANPPHADYKYALLEGNDSHPDVGYARWIAGSDASLGLFTGRTLAYEAEPFMENTEWFTRGGVGSQHWGNGEQTAWHISVHTNVRWATEVLEQKGYDDVRFQERYAWDQQGQVFGPWVRDLYNEGLAVTLVRAENYFWRNNFNGVDENVVFPIRLATSGHGEWSTWNQIRNGSGNNLKGPVASTCGWGGPATVAMSVCWLNLVSGVMNHDMGLGWGYVYAITNFENYVPNMNFRGQGIYPQVKTDTDVYGDPGIRPWNQIPDQYQMTHIETINTQTDIVEVYVFDPENDDHDEIPIEGARVTLYMPGDLPNDVDDYVELEPFMMTILTDSDGMARFVFEEDNEFEEGTMFCTLTGRTILPVFHEIEVEDPDAAIELASYELNETQGEEDGIVNPGETFSLTISAVNIADEGELNDVVAVVSSISSWIEVGENELSFGAISAGETVESEDRANFQVNESCPDGEARPSTKPILFIDFSSGDLTWRSAIHLNPSSPNFTIRNIPGGIVIQDTLYELDIDLENIGRANSSALSAELITMGMGISVVEGIRNYPNINSGDNSRLADRDLFLISGNSVVVPGSRTPMLLILTNEEGFVDTTRFELQVSEAGDGTPQGPDEFGYLCFDDTDDAWEISPDYEWLEISLEDDDREFDGELLDFEGRSDFDVGESIVVDLPFATQFYGELFDQITVCTNGYICLGDQEIITNMQNWPMDQAFGGGAGMIAPFWDWLDLDDGGIYTYYDEEDNKFIVEWYRLRHHQGGNSDLTFQVILYDNGIWITESGDQNILMQYKTISQVRGQMDGVAWEKNVPFASVGISSVDGTTGLNYTFNNDYPSTSAVLANRRAILFSTSPRYKACNLWGNVSDHETGESIQEAIVVTQHGFTAITDVDGNWRIVGALAEVPFNISARKQGYNDSTRFGPGDGEESFEVEEGDSLEIDFVLLHPEFSPSTYDLGEMLDPGTDTEMGFSLENTGNGPMFWDVERRLLGDANARPWEFRQSFHVGEDLEDARVQAVAFADNHFFIASGNNTEPIISRYNRNYELVEQISQPEAVQGDRKGFRDLAWDGELLWGAHRDRVYGINLEGEVIEEWESPFGYTSAITYDSDLDVIWIAYTTNNPVAFTREGEQVEGLEINRRGLRIYGMAYWLDDPDDHPIYVFHKDQFSGLPLVHKFNSESDTIRVSFVDRVNGELPLGAFITNQYDVYSWVFMDVKDIGDAHGGDQMEIWQLAARREWFQLDVVLEDERAEASAGTLQTGEVSEFILMLNSTDLPETTFVSELFFTHNADSGKGHIMIELEVIGPRPPTEFDLLEPADTDTVGPDEVAFEWEASIDPNSDEDATYELKFRASEETLSIPLDSIGIMIDFDTLAINLEWMFENMTSWWVEALSGEDTTISNQTHSFLMARPQMPPSEPVLTTPEDESVLESSTVIFNWETSLDSNPEDSVYYQLLILNSGDTLAVSLADTFKTINFYADTTNLNFDMMFIENTIWWVNAVSGEDIVSSEIPFSFIFDPIARIGSDEIIPVEFEISAIYPNPFNSSTTIRFGADVAKHTSLKIYDLSGRQVAVLFNGMPKIGWYNITWNGTNLPSGLYLVKLESAGRAKFSKMTMLK